MATTKDDDLGAVKDVVDALTGFESSDQERIIRWAREKLGLPQTSGTGGIQAVPGISGTHTPPAPPSPENVQRADIKTFITSKNPKNDKHFAATVAYYYRFVAQDNQKDSITKDDLQNATRLADRSRIKHPAQTLINALNAGLLDRAGSGSYTINAVGENLVAMALPGGAEGQPTAGRPAKKKKRAVKKKARSRRRN